MRRKLSKTLPVHLIIVTVLTTALPSFAFDFGSIHDGLKKIDINKVYILFKHFEKEKINILNDLERLSNEL